MAKQNMAKENRAKENMAKVTFQYPLLYKHKKGKKAMETQVAFLYSVPVSSNIFSSIYQREEQAACKGMGYLRIY